MTPDPGPGRRADRTLRYTGGRQPATGAALTCGPATAAAVPGQVAVLTTTNLLARAHPQLILAGGAVPGGLQPGRTATPAASVRHAIHQGTRWAGLALAR
jgi:hypothetical protein